MIITDKIQTISPILLTLLVIFYLILTELGNPNLKKTLHPFVIALIVVFAVLAVISVYRTYVGLG
ncbi:hypothetical protein ACFL0X_00730 [Nanoarchaeota archaeon]